MSNDEFHARFGPTAGDRIRVADSDLWLSVEEDRQAHGDEPIWGYGKTIRLREAQSSEADPSELDTILIGALIVDPVLGVLKADIGIKDGWIVGIGAAGNPAISDGIDLAIGPHTEPIIAYGLVATPGAVDSHVHLITPELIPAALAAGRDDADHRRLRGAAVGNGAHAARVRGLADQPGDAGERAGGGRLDARCPARCGCRGLQDPRGLRRVPGADRCGAALCRRARRERVAAHRWAQRGGRAGRHGGRHRRADRARLPRRGRRRRPRAGRHRPGPPPQHHLQLDHADHPVWQSTPWPNTWR